MAAREAKVVGTESGGSGGWGGGVCGAVGHGGDGTPGASNPWSYFGRSFSCSAVRLGGANWKNEKRKQQKGGKKSIDGKGRIPDAERSRARAVMRQRGVEKMHNWRFKLF